MSEPANVLIVDDDEDNNGVAAAVLAATGHNVAIVGSVADVLPAIEGASPHVILLGLPAPTQEALAYALSQHQLTRHIPVVLLGRDRSEMPAELSAASIRLDKPVAPDALVEIVRRSLVQYVRQAVRPYERSEFSSEAVRIQEEERRKLSVELHDDVAQVLANLVLVMDTCLALASEEAAELRNHLAGARETAKDGLRRVQRFSIDLRPPMLDDLGLTPTVGWYAERFAQDSGVTVNLELPRALQGLGGEQETALFRIVQEALHNVRRHANARNVDINMLCEGGRLRLVVSDDGVGFDPQELTEKLADGTHLGIAGMRYRIRLIKGSFRIDSRAGNGTTVTVEIPVSLGC